MTPTEYRHQLRAAGFAPVPLYGKAPPAYGKNNQKKGLGGWQQLHEVSAEMIEMWGRTWPDAANTGCLTRLMPVLDLDILNEDAAQAIEHLVHERFEDRGYVLTRIGKPPKRAFPFRTNEPFAKIVVSVAAPKGANEQKVELLCDGQQLVVAGIHPDTRAPYRWHGGELGQIKLENLPYISAADARELVDDVVALLVRDFGYIAAKERRKPRNGAAAEDAGGSADWKQLLDNIREGRALHDSLRDLAGKMVKAGMDAGAVINQLRALLEGSAASRDERWKDRFAEIPALVDSAAEKIAEDARPKPPPGPPSTIDETLAAFNKWLILESTTPLLAMLGAVSSHYLPGDPCWLGVVAPPSSAKTELLNSISMLPEVVPVATLTVGALLSGTSKKSRDKNAKGGLLRHIGQRGLISLKDFGSVLSMHTETRAEVLAALRELYDGAWTRHLGTDGGRTLHWSGKLGLVFGATAAIDAYHSVIGALGDRWLLTRMAPPVGKKQFRAALKHDGVTVEHMRKELAESVARLFAGRRAQSRPLTDDEADRIGDVISLVVRLRGGIERDRRTREMEMILGAEGTARIGLSLARLTAGLDTLGVPRDTAMQVVLSVAMDSVPPIRRAAFACVEKHGDVETADVAIELGLPTTTVRRALEELAAYGLVERQSRGQGKADIWVKCLWQTD